MNINRNEIRKGGYILEELVRKNVKNQYRNSWLGALWTVLNPLLNMLVMYFVFSRMFGRDDPYYALYLLSGNIIFTLMRTATTTSLNSLVSNAGLITKVKVPYSLFPTSNVLSATVNFLFAFAAYFIVMIIFSLINQLPVFHLSMFLVLIALPLLMIFSLGMSLILSALFVFFRDIEHLYGVFLTLWMYLTPIFYKIDALQLGSFAETVINLNPMYQFIDFFRNVTYMGVIPSAESFLMITAWAIGFLVIGLLIFKMTKRHFILYL